jgi:hypothetical protein
LASLFGIPIFLAQRRRAESSAKFSFAIGKSLYIGSVSFLTKQEQMVLCLVVLLLLTGWAVKTYRTAHPAAVPIPLPAQKT